MLTGEISDKNDSKHGKSRIRDKFRAKVDYYGERKSLFSSEPDSKRDGGIVITRTFLLLFLESAGSMELTVPSLLWEQLIMQKFYIRS